LGSEGEPVDDELRERWKCFRFEVIGELLDPNLDRAERARIRKKVLATTYIRPDGKTWRIAERTLADWLQRYEREQLAGLGNRMDKRKGEMKALDPKVLEQAKTLRLALPSRSIADIRSHLKYVANLDVSKISASTLNRHLNRVGATKDKNYSEKGIFTPFQKEHINQLWQSDFTHGIYLPDPTGLKEVRRTTLITCIDDASRFCVHGQFYFSESLNDLLDCFRTALLSRGKGSVLYTDNGSIYKSNDFAHICSELGVTLKHC
jgi:putative transposase